MFEIFYDEELGKQDKIKKGMNGRGGSGDNKWNQAFEEVWP